MKKLINKIPDRYYLISIILILLIMVFCTFFTTNFRDIRKVKLYFLPQSLFPGLSNMVELAWFFPSQLLLPFTVITVLYFYIKDNHSQAVINFLTVKEDDITKKSNKKYLFIILSIICFFLHHYYMVLLLFPMFLYLHAKYAYKSNKFIQHLNNIYKIIHLLFLIYRNIISYESFYSKISYEIILILIVISILYMIVLSYYISKKTMLLYIILSIIPAIFIFINISIGEVYFYICIFLLNYILIYYKYIILAFIMSYIFFIYVNIDFILSYLIPFIIFRG